MLTGGLSPQILVEKTIHAFSLLEALTRSGCSFIFMGGSSLSLLFFFLRGNMLQRYTKILSHPSHHAKFPVYRGFKWGTPSEMLKPPKSGRHSEFLFFYLRILGLYDAWQS